MPLAEKIVANKPPTSTTSAADPGVEPSARVDAVCELDHRPAPLRHAAHRGGRRDHDRHNECQLKPLRRADTTRSTFTDAQWAQLQATFPEGVCDYSKPGVGQQGTIPWQTYQRRRRRRDLRRPPLGPAPKGSGTGWTSPEFSGWLAAEKH